MRSVVALPPLTLVCLTAGLAFAQPEGRRTHEAGEPELLTFEQAMEIATARAKDAVRAREDLLLVDVQHKAALSAILPRVDVSASAGIVGTIDAPTVLCTGQPSNFCPEGFVGELNLGGTGSNLTAQASLRQLIFDGGRWWTVIARVKDFEASRKAAEKTVANDLRARVAERFYGLISARQASRVLHAQIEVGEALLDRARAMMSAGRGKISDVAIAERNVAEDRILLARRKLTEEQARRALNLELGRAADLKIRPVIPEHVATASAAVEKLRLVSEEKLVAAALQNRPEIAGIDAEIRAADKNITIAAADYWPNLSLGANIQKQSRGGAGSEFGNPVENFYSLDLTVRWNLFEGRANNARVEEAEINLKKLYTDKADLERRIAAEVQDRLQTLQTQLDVYTLSQTAVTAAGEAVRLARGLFEQGAGTQLELRDAEQKFSQARLSAITARLDVEIAKEALQRAIGMRPEEVN